MNCRPNAGPGAEHGARGEGGAGGEGGAYRLDLQYDGSAFRGWAKQPGLPSVQGALETALRRAVGEVPTMQVAGRTDSGVHAMYQVVGFRLTRRVDPASLARSIDALTPPEIGLLRCVEVPAHFDARRKALTRTYRYHVDTSLFESPFLRRYSWHVRHPVDFDVLECAAACVVGRHDFTAFTPSETHHVFFHRTVNSCSWDRSGPLLWLEIEANAFLRQMVRSLVGTMIELGRGKMTVTEFASLLRGGSRPQAGPTAPARGLFLWTVKYPDEEPPSALTPQQGSIIMPTCVSRRYGEDLFGKTR